MSVANSTEPELANNRQCGKYVLKELLFRQPNKSVALVRIHYLLQHEIDALRHRAALIQKVGENLHKQQPNQPFVQGL